MGSERLVLPLSWFLESELIVGQIMSLIIFEPIIGLVPAWAGINYMASTRVMC